MARRGRTSASQWWQADVWRRGAAVIYVCGAVCCCCLSCSLIHRRAAQLCYLQLPPTLSLTVVHLTWMAQGQCRLHLPAQPTKRLRDDELLHG